MPDSRPKSTDGLMRYLRDKKGISISGSSQKRKLMNIGYYHGYKGYRYIKYTFETVALLSRKNESPRIQVKMDL